MSQNKKEKAMAEQTGRHFTAVIEILKVTPEHVITQQYKEDKVIPRSSQEVTRLIIRGSTLEQLKERITKHVELVGE